MDIECLSLKQTGYFSKLICDYIDQKEELNSFYNRFPKLENFKGQIEEKAANFPDRHRSILYEALIKQYSEIEITKNTKEHLIQLKEPITFTVVTGHQLNLFTGPLYFLYKIVSTINLTKELKKAYPKFNFVPIYWMATEDHDFDEINFFNLKNMKLQWEREASGGVGRLNTQGLEGVYSALKNELGGTKNAAYLVNLFREAYLEHDNLGKATRYLANKLFGDEGLVIVDGDDKVLKELLVPYIKKDVFEHTAYHDVSTSIEGLKSQSSSYKIQVNPREINYFYLKDDLRERLIGEGDSFKVNDTDIKFTKNELENEIINHPERFSPNVITRPLYQEVILPNLCYIGGGGELAYWLELHQSFKTLDVTFPILLPRNSALVVTPKQQSKIQKLALEIENLFMGQNELINKKIRDISDIEIDFSKQKGYLENHFKEMYELANKTDKSFIGAVKAQEVKQLKGLEFLEKRLLKAQKRKLKDQVTRMVTLQNELFPNGSLQERNLNFSEFYMEYGDMLIPYLLRSLKPLKLEFSILYH